jgi:hypothetical protein
MRPIPASAPSPAAAQTLRQQLADPGALSGLQRLRLANTLALGAVADSAKNTLAHPGTAIAETVKGLGQMLTKPGDMVSAAQQAWSQDRREGAILSGRLLAGYVGMAGMAIGGAALLGRLGAGTAKLPNLAFALQKTGQVAFRAAGIAGTTAVGIDAAALAVHEVDAAGATTKRDLANAIQRLHGDMNNLAANGVTAGLSKAGGAGMRALATHLREQELAGSLAATNRAVKLARQSNGSLSAQQMARVKLSGTVADASLVDELSSIVGRRAKHMSAGERVQLAEYLNQSLSQVEQSAAGKAIATKLGPGVAVDDLIGLGEKAAWEVSGISSQTLQALQRRGWTGDQLRSIREALRGADLFEGQQVGAMQRTAQRLLKAPKPTEGIRSIQHRVVRQAVEDGLQEIGVTRSLEKVPLNDLQHLNHHLNGADPRTRVRLVGMLNDTKGKLPVTEFWLKAYEHLYADLGVDPAVYRSLAPKEVTMSGVTALERVHSQLKMLPTDARMRVSKAISAVELKPGDASRIMKQAHIGEMTGQIRKSLPKGEQAKAPAIAEALVKELLDGEAVRTREVIATGAKQLPSQMLRGNVKAIPAFARIVGRTKAETESLVASVSSAIGKLPQKTRQQLFTGLNANRPLGSQLTNRLTKMLREDFNVDVKRTQTHPKVHDELVIADMDAAGALNLYNALEAMSGPERNLPRLAKNGVFARTASHDYGGIALDGEDGYKYTVVSDAGMVEGSWHDPAGSTHSEGIWTHEVGHQMQATWVTPSERARIADWSKLGDWKHGNGKIADGTHPYRRTDNAIYKDPAVGGNTRESVTGYAKTDPAEDWAEFVRIGTHDPVAALQTSPPKFLYFASQMAVGWANRLQAWANEAGVNLPAARNEAVRRLGDGHPAIARIDKLLAGLSD